MRKKLFLIFLMGLFGLSQLSNAEDLSVLEKKIHIAEESSQKETSKATIGFSSKSKKTITTGRLPTTGEFAGIGISLFGLMLIIIIFRNELKEMIKNKKNRGDERE